MCGKPPHPLHKAFAESIGADFFHAGDAGLKYILTNLNKIPKNYDIYFTEGLFVYTVLSRWLGFIKKSAKIINIFSDPRIYQLWSGKKFDFKTNSVKKFPSLKKWLLKKIISKVDAGICVGKFEKDILNSLFPKMPSKSVKPCINKTFFNLKPQEYNKNNILFVGGGPDFDYKGLDFLIETFAKLREDCSWKIKPELYVVGSNWEKFQKSHSIPRGVKFLGGKSPEEIIKLSKNCSVYCHFGRGEAYGLVVLEAMAMGLYPIVSDLTGAKEAVEDVGLRPYSFDDQKGILKTIKNQLNASKKDKKKLGKKFMDYAGDYTLKSSLVSFKSEFFKLVKELEKNEKS